jgi:alginate O-acetyltransferase complex protein AlgI
VYIPLGGNRCGKLRHSFNLFVTFLISGLWHGANWTYVVWGALHGGMQIVENFLFKRPKSKKPPVHNARWGVSVVTVFCLCTVAWVFFRASTLHDAMYVFQHTLAGITHPLSYVKTGLTSMGIGMGEAVSLLFSTALLAAYDFADLKTDVIVRVGRCRKTVVRWLIYVLIFFAIVFLRPVNSGGEFIYFQF